MVDFPTTVQLVHESYRELGGEYQTEDAAQELMSFASDIWNENKEELKAAAKEVAKTAIKKAVRRRYGA